MKSTIIRNIIIIIAIFLITYSLADSINNYNALGVFLALGGFGALCVFLYLFSQLQQLKEIEEEEKQQ